MAAVPSATSATPEPRCGSIPSASFPSPCSPIAPGPIARIKPSSKSAPSFTTQSSKPYVGADAFVHPASEASLLHMPPGRMRPGLMFCPREQRLALKWFCSRLRFRKAQPLPRTRSTNSNLENLSTEQLLPTARHLDRMSSLEIARLINHEDANVAARRAPRPAADRPRHRRRRRMPSARADASFTSAPAPADALALSMPRNSSHLQYRPAHRAIHHGRRTAGPGRFHRSQ